MTRRRGPVRAEIEILRHRAEAARMYLRGYTQAEIAEALGISQQQVSEDLKALRAAFVEQAQGDIAQWIADEIARTHMIEQEAWREWERSKRPRKLSGRKSVEGDKARDEEWEREEERLADPRYLERILACMEYRAELRGLKAARRTEVSGPDGTPISITASVESRQLIATLEKRLLVASEEERALLIADYEELTERAASLAERLSLGGPEAGADVGRAGGQDGSHEDP